MVGREPASTWPKSQLLRAGAAVDAAPRFLQLAEYYLRLETLTARYPNLGFRIAEHRALADTADYSRNASVSPAKGAKS